MTIWLIFAFALFGRLADVISTRLVTPKLALEGNPLVRRFGWGYAWISLSLALLTFVSADFGIIIGTFSCLMAHSNMSFALISRFGVGEQKLREFYFLAIKNCGAGSYIGMFLVQFLPLLAVACALLFFGRFDTEPYVADVAYGIFCWVLAMAILKLKVIRVIGKEPRCRAGAALIVALRYPLVCNLLGASLRLPAAQSQECWQGLRRLC